MGSILSVLMIVSFYQGLLSAVNGEKTRKLIAKINILNKKSAEVSFGR